MVKISLFLRAIPVRIRVQEKIDKRHIALTWQPNGCTGKVEVDCAIALPGLSAFLFAISIVGMFLKRNASTGADRRGKMAQIVRQLAIYD